MELAVAMQLQARTVGEFDGQAVIGLRAQGATGAQAQSFGGREGILEATGPACLRIAGNRDDMCVRRLLPQLVPPLLIVYSAGDRAIHPASAERTFARAGSRDKQIIKLEESGHVITVDRHWRFVADQTLAWVKQHGG